jgi:hypothetical protein
MLSRKSINKSPKNKRNMKRVLFTLSFICIGAIAFSQTPKKDVQLKDLGVQSSNPGGPGKPDPKPADVPPMSQSPVIKKATEIYQKAGSPTPVTDQTRPNGKVIGVKVTVPQ